MSLPRVQWRPSPNHWRGRAGHVAIAEVKHRIVGTLASAISLFDQPSTREKPRPSTHFCIGYLGGQLAVTQHVDLGDTAWGNGDVRSPTWSLLVPGVNPNHLTISTEHEDGGAANRGRVSEAVWQASIELSRILRSGDVDRIRGAGIRVSDRPGVTASQLVTAIAAWPIDAAHYIDHHQISGPNKPYCFRRWLDDPGFVEGSPSRRDRLLAALAGAPQEDDVPIITKTVREQWDIPAGTELWIGGPRMGERRTFPVANRLWSNGETDDGDWRRIEGAGPTAGQEFYVKRWDMKPVPGTRDPASGYGPPALGDADCASAVAQAEQETKAKTKQAALEAITAL